MKHVVINGFGRIGRSFLRSYLLDKKAQKSIKIIAINVGPANKEWSAHLFKYDTFMGTWPEKVVYKDNYLSIGNHKILILQTTDPAELPWKKLKVDWVVDSSGQFTHQQEAQKHIAAGAKKVLITAFAQDPDVTVVMGVNEGAYDPEIHRIVSLASCTANAFYPIVKTLHDAFEVEFFSMNALHSYTNRQVLMDVESVSLRRSRGAAQNIIPTTLQASHRIREVYPKFSGSIAGQSTRIPVGKVSFLDVAFVTEAVVKVADINEAFMRVAQDTMQGVVNISGEPLVSSDYINNPYSVTIDESLTSVAGPLGKVFGWYDNEAGYSHRVKDFLVRHG